MNFRAVNSTLRKAPGTQAWTLLEMLGILAVVAILAAVLLPAFIKEADKGVADQEKATLKSLADAFEEYVLSTRVIPDQTTWHSAVASRLGLGTNDILYNVRQQTHLRSRVFLIESNGFALPYAQSSQVGGLASPTFIPRLMVVSSLGTALPNAVASGIFSASHPEYFSDLWNAADGTIPSDSAWTGWTGNPGDVIVQRINLAPLFVHLFLSQYHSSNLGAYRIDGSPAPPVALTDVNGYFIQGTVLGLYTGSSPSYVFDTQQILSRDASFLLQNGIWVGSLSGSSMAQGILNIGDVVQQFLSAPTNGNAAVRIGNAQQVLVVSNMLSYMSNYNVWARPPNNFNNPALKSYLIGIQGGMMSTIQGLYQNPANFPTNSSPCL